MIRFEIIEYSEKGEDEIMIEKDAYRAEKEARERRLMAYSDRIHVVRRVRHKKQPIKKILKVY